MNTFSIRNAHQGLPVILDRLFKRGVKRSSRNGDVLQLVGPTLIEYERPMERVVFWEQRDANPFFHLLESMWMLAGRNDLKFVEGFVKNMRSFSDDGETINGAYGYRWRNWFDHDQLTEIALNLKHNPNCRRQVLSMWDGWTDLVNKTSRDVPCNTHAYFSVNPEGCVDMTVCNRSNDLVWGALGANAVHFSYLLEYMAALIGRPPGRYYQFTNNLHGYLTTIEPLQELTRMQGLACPYELGQVQPFYINQHDTSLMELDFDLLDAGACSSEFFRKVVSPVRALHISREQSEACLVQASDWRLACEQWLARRRKNKAKDDGVSYE